jgi:hypothetical protein|tara:strand:- start:1179 stop:1628 length:450 start_codon:yes stop_codon:yes gene_type:complete
MAHFAKISEENEVLQVLTLDDKDCVNSEGVEIESIGQTYLETHNNWPAHLWIKTSYNTLNNTHRLGGTPFRGNYAGIGYTWDSENQIFWPSKPYPSWVKNTTTALWVSPIGDSPELTEEQNNQNQAFTHQWIYSWDEANQQWNLIDNKS